MNKDNNSILIEDESLEALLQENMNIDKSSFEEEDKSNKKKDKKVLLKDTNKNYLKKSTNNDKPKKEKTDTGEKTVNKESDIVEDEKHIDEETELQQEENLNEEELLNNLIGDELNNNIDFNFDSEPMIEGEIVDFNEEDIFAALSDEKENKESEGTLEDNEVADLDVSNDEEEKEEEESIQNQIQLESDENTDEFSDLNDAIAQDTTLKKEIKEDKRVADLKDLEDIESDISNGNKSFNKIYLFIIIIIIAVFGIFILNNRKIDTVSSDITDEAVYSYYSELSNEVDNTILTLSLYLNNRITYDVMITDLESEAINTYTPYDDINDMFTEYKTIHSSLINDLKNSKTTSNVDDAVSAYVDNIEILETDVADKTESYLSANNVEYIRRDNEITVTNNLTGGD